MSIGGEIYSLFLLTCIVYNRTQLDIVISSNLFTFFMITYFWHSRGRPQLLSSDHKREHKRLNFVLSHFLLLFTIFI